jgi:hypothetical protein
MTEPKQILRVFALIVGIMSCVVAALYSVYLNHGAEGLAYVTFISVSLFLLLILCAVITIYICFHDK